MNVLNASIIAAVAAAKSVEASSGKVWNGIAEFAINEGLNEDTAKDAFKEQENLYMEKHKVQPSTYSTYRSAKSVCMNALKNNIDLVDAEGKPRGKTEIEKAIKAARDENKTPFDKWIGMFDRLNEQTNSLMGVTETSQAWQAVDKLQKKLTEMFEMEQEKQPKAA